MGSLYIHIPFCHSKCGYCSFASWPGLEQLHARYVEAVQNELTKLARRHGGQRLSTIFFGGGTPTVLSVRQLEMLLDCCVRLFGVAPAAEVSLEANPGTVDGVQLAELRRAGFTRISMGVQSFLEADLRALGRCHSAGQAVTAFTDARAAGFKNISLDLMYGLPEQTVASWRHNLDTVLSLGPEHISMYQLTIEEGTGFSELHDQGALALPAEEQIIAMDELNLELCSLAGYDWYEVSNYARPGYRCLHNLNYWHNGEYLAAGAGAVSYLAGVRARRTEDPSDYITRIESGHSPLIESEKLGLDESFRETVIMGLRLSEGVEIKRLQAQYGLDPLAYYGNTLKKLLADGLMECSETHLKISAKGRLLSNAIMAELV